LASSSQGSAMAGTENLSKLEVTLKGGEEEGISFVF
jgi:hypothetical protein